ncbi:putative ATPase [Beggiatoa alba B18LD]|uniref:Putative ATPase n=1 Tax=Beggiatoa alba B18LD TaxID=395493 RepID=I3CJK2_9GAMM|nr:ATP-binding protein [Beggiatoa alba]EIJ43795.1 putative ATPase [Beggiatoa alba B18LD]
MIESIEIKNFRCFDSFKMSGFKTINLIGGINNAGKTALLEAILIASFPFPSLFNTLKQFRPTSENEVWAYFFHNREIDKPISLKLSKHDSSDSSDIEVSYNSGFDLNNIIEIQDKEVLDFLSKQFSNKCMAVKGNFFGEKLNYIFSSFVEEEATSKKSGVRTVGITPKKEIDTYPFLHTNYRLNNKSHAKLYSDLKQQNKNKTYDELIQLLDKHIISSEIDAPNGEPVVKLILDNGQALPISMFGDAIRKIAELSLLVLNNENRIIFIDEIENGIHFTKHQDIWEKLFEISTTNKMQIFATSHSAEMIKAFNHVALSAYSEHASYLEMSISPRSQRVMANHMDMETLAYQLATKSTYRGE